jgi:hypothetical protein
VWAAVAAVAALLVGIGGWFLGHSDAPGPRPTALPAHVVSAQLTADHHSVGEVVIWTGKDPWVSMAVEGDLGAGEVACQLRTAHGAPITVGWFALKNGRGYWVSAIGKTGSPVIGAQVVDYSGGVVASATLPPTTL